MASHYILASTLRPLPEQSGAPDSSQDTILPSLSEIWSFAYTPDARLVSGSLDGSLYLWPSQDNSESLLNPILLDKLPLGIMCVHIQPSAFTASAFVPSDDDPAFICITTSLDSRIRRYNVSSMTDIREPMVSDEISCTCSALHPTQSKLAVAGKDGDVNFVSMEEDSFGQILSTIQGNGTYATAIAYSNDGSLGVIGDDAGLAHVWSEKDIRHSAPSFITTFASLSLSCRSITFSSDSQLIVAGGDDKVISVHELSSSENVIQRNIALIAHHTGRVISLAFSIDGKVLASGSSDGFIRLYDFRDLSTPTTILREHKGDVWSIAWQPELQKVKANAGEIDGIDSQIRAGRFSSAGQDGLIRCWRGMGT